MSDTDPKKSGDNIEANISGNISGQVAVGKGITQTQTILQTGGKPTAEELSQLKQLFDDLTSSITASSSGDKDKALERVEELREAVTADEPDVSTMEYVKKWFGKNLPEFAGNVTGLVVHPIVGKLVHAAGDAVVGEFKRRFGDS